MGAYYNEIDPYAAAWLRNLIAAGHIAPGDVDERDIQDVRPEDLRGYSQHHFFAGVGVWSLALRRAGWPDDRSVWTGSCPCQPFSQAGKGLAFADERHLWPAWYHLISECRPAIVFGEQVAGKGANAWIDLVQDDMEAVDYAVGAVPFPAAGVGAPHIRDRLYWVAHADGGAGGKGREIVRGRLGRGDAQPWARSRGGRVLDGMADADGRHTGAERQQRGGQQRQQPEDGCAVAWVANADSTGLAQCERLTRLSGGEGSADARQASERGGLRPARWLADSERQRIRPRRSGSTGGASGALQGDDGKRKRVRADSCPTHDASSSPAGPTNGFWRDADWLQCRDGRWRPVEPGTFPLADGAPARVGRLRAYGNAINAEAARAFIEHVTEWLR
ncbi:DNA cytosine methyltransferase [Ralstonia pseudosolanacearum]|uniref:DNA cytosine methyltransferase n=1 Tax=Ralstonia pseudosolanacearum TaxID=1310165 RepID=UPI003CFE08D6